MTAIIPSQDIREYVVNFLENKTPEYFKHVPASSSGKYHPKYALGDDGLIRHTMAAVYFGNEICKLEYLRLSQKTKSKILAALFMHDSWKQGALEQGKTDLMDHAKFAADKVDDSEIALYMLSHMGQWGINKPGTIEAF